MRVFKALTIAGSDSGGGAGIQADLKTFAALKVHGMSVVTSITAQNTVEVTGIHDVPVEMVEKQIDAVVSDIGVDAAKTGMLHTSDIIEAVAGRVERYKFPLVVDPVMVAKSGARLLRREAEEALKKKLIPLARVVTPNAMEAAVLSGVKVKDVKGAKKAAAKISEMGAEGVVVKGGHLPGDGEAVDVLYYRDEFHFFKGEKIDALTTHGTGCSFSAAIAAELAKGTEVVDAVEKAKELITLAVRFGLKIGGGHGPVNPLAILYRESEKPLVLKKLIEAIDILEGNSAVSLIVPEVGMNLAVATSYAHELTDVAAIPGRIVNVNGRVKASHCPKFGCSRHVAKYVLTAMKHNSEVRSAVNIRYSDEILEILRGMNLKISHYDRRREPKETKAKEGLSVYWGAEEAIRKAKGVPDVIYHLGDWGKEPMIILLGRDPLELVNRILGLAESLIEGGVENRV